MTRYYSDLHPRVADPAEWTLEHVLRHQAGERGEAVFLDCPEEDGRWTYGELLEQCEAVAGGLFEAGAGVGDRVVIMAGNSSQLVRTWFATAVGNLVQVPINTAYEGEFLRHQVSTVEPRWAVIDDRFATRFAAIAERIPTLERFWVIDTGESDAAIDALQDAGWTAERWDDLLDHPAVAPLPQPTPADLSAILFTSGTTGLSKGVAMPHAQMHFFAEEVVALTRLTSDDVYLTVTPLFHGNAQFMAVYPTLIAGGRIVVRSRFSASRWVDQLREGGITVTNFLGVMMDFIWKQAPRPDDADNRLRCVFAAPTAHTIVDAFRERFGIEAFVEVFGLTETSAPILSPYGMPRPAGAAGLAVADWFDIRLVDPDSDIEVDVGEVGELVVRPKVPWICSMGYYGMAAQTVETWRNLWFHTGDALRRDHDGWYYFIDRYKDTLRRRGENISSYEIEQAILGLDGVVECAVIGVPADVEAGEDEVLAAIVTDAPIDPDQVWAWCTGRIPEFAIPRYLRFVESLPKTPSEKIRKATLRAEGRASGAFDRMSTAQA